MLIYKRNVHTKMRALSYIGAEKITFPPKPDRQTDITTFVNIYSFFLKKKSGYCLDAYRISSNIYDVSLQFGKKKLIFTLLNLTYYIREES